VLKVFFKCGLLGHGFARSLADPSRAPAIAADVVMLDDIHEVNRVPLHSKHDPIAAADPTFEVVLIRKDRLHVEARRVGSLDESHGDAITGSLTVSSQPRVALPPLVGPDGGTDGGPGRQGLVIGAVWGVCP